MTTDFFTEATLQSQTKARIVSKYFDAWAKVVAPAAKKRGTHIGYIDLFSGPGRYEDGSDSTPILVLRKAIGNPFLHDLLETRFNDSDKQNVDALEQAIAALPGIDKLKHKPQVSCSTVDDRITQLIEKVRLIPTLTFVDPFGYKGLTMRLIQATLKDWGCDCVFFFNFNRVNAAIHNDHVEHHVANLFDTEDARILREALSGLRTHEREEKVIEHLVDALKKKKKHEYEKHVLHFTFLNATGSRTSHHLVFVTKHPRGCKIMKDIMAKESSWEEGGVPSFSCSPVAREPTLFDNLDELDDLEQMLLDAFAGAKLTVAEIYEKHGLDKPYVPKNYKTALKRLETTGRIHCDPPAEKRRNDTMGEAVIVQFPPKGA